MTALSAARDIPRLGDDAIPELVQGLQKGSTTIYQGALVVWDAGYLAPATSATGKIVAGIALRTTTNSGADGANGKIELRRGCYPMKSADLVQADVGKDVYVVDDQTVSVSSNSGTRSKAGRFVQLDGSDFYVMIGVGVGDQALAPGAAVANTAAAAANTAGGATPSAAQVDTGIATAVAPIVTSLNALLASLRAANIILT